MIEFFVAGEPRTGGHPTAFVDKHGKAHQAEGGATPNSRKKYREWRKALKAEIAKHKLDPLLDEPLSVQLTFHLYPLKQPRPWPHKGLDIDTLCRPVFDELTGQIWIDDSRPCSLSADKIYIDPEINVTGVHIWIESLLPSYPA